MPSWWTSKIWTPSLRVVDKGSVAVVNASPLIFLSRAGLVDLLRTTAERVVVPEAVADEIRRRGPSDPTALVLDQERWLETVPVARIPVEIVAWDLGPGESAVLAWAQANPGAEAILDDLLGRKCSATLGIPMRGTLGLVLLARQRGIIPAARPVLDRLRTSGMYLGDAVLLEALKRVGER